MKKLLLYLVLPILFTLPGRAQTTALDFNQQDCNGSQHHLFSELDGGSVVVISFVMMNCSSCIDATSDLKTVTEGYASSNPNRVKLYSFGYLDSYTCPQMLAWRSLGGFTHPVFTGGQAQTNYYGGMGMPTIVVLATNNHTVLYSKLGYTTDDKPAIISAINQGLLYNPNGIEDQEQASVKIFPLQVSDRLNIKLNNPETGFISISDLTGREILRNEFNNTSSFTEDVSNLHSGLYIVNLFGTRGKITTVKILKY